MLIWQALAEQDPSNPDRQTDLRKAKPLSGDVVIAEVFPRSRAQALGLKVSDVLLSYDRRKVLNAVVLPYMTAPTRGSHRELRLRATEKKSR